MRPSGQALRSLAAKASASASVFRAVDSAPPLEIFSVVAGFARDTHPSKVDLGIGAYRTNEGQPWVMPWVQRIEQLMGEDKTRNHEYLTFLGCDTFSQAATALLLGPESDVVRQGKAFGIQSLGGTGCVRIGSEFLSRVLNYNTAYIPAQTWDNHHRVMSRSGFTHLKEYRYWHPLNKALDFEGLTEDLSSAPKYSVVVLHPCAHNPTGCDPTQEQWDRIADIIQERKLFPFFDTAYQGLASGDVDQDAWAVRHFVKRELELFCAQSFSKSCGLYGERIGNLTVVLHDPDQIEKMRSQFRIIVRALYCSPPRHGAQIVSTMLQDPNMQEEWRACLREMAGRIRDMRHSLRQKLEGMKTPGTWEHITKQVGMFSFTGLTEHQVQYMKEKHHIYMLSSGRANMCGLNNKNLDYVASAIHNTVTQIK
ncbi:aspartate aminotransferase, cytoplasmic-like [Schistocerca cancellata]|uniref:aspartate aminotransferase, cytoplasmic-like n=1 Tax=Schistocerca cancellata TaxID=274614 RepID=UPI0021191FD1|nr:aspartate aminotransferase, cytoplasmic-like [Schistocerca cancellata]